MKRLLLEDAIQEAEGIITEEQDLIWQSTELAIKDKLDAYGFLFSELEAEKKKLQAIKASGLDRVRAAETRIENLEKRLKFRLNGLSGGETLRGHIYSFHPFMSKHLQIKDVERLAPSETYLTVEIRQDHWDRLVKPDDILFTIKGKKGRVSELLEDHPQVETFLSPSVRIT
jgi:hypothetical protein